VLYRPLTREELAAVGAHRGPLGATEGYLVERVVHRRDLDRAVATLPCCFPLAARTRVLPGRHTRHGAAVLVVGRVERVRRPGGRFAL